MKSYYHDEASGITIYHGDCREVLPNIDANAVVSDPPYGIALRNGDVDGHRSGRWNNIEGDLDSTIGEFVLSWASARNIPAILFSSPWKPWSGKARNLIVWDKGGAVGGGGDIRTCLKRSWELIQVYRNGPFVGPRDESVWRYPIVPDDTAIHICFKPIPLMERLIAKFVPSGVIVDPCCGSGSTLEAAKLLGHRAIGVEIEERYCEIAAKRLAQGVLFGAGATS